jgi:hypothetical protein
VVLPTATPRAGAMGYCCNNNTEVEQREKKIV